MIAVFNQILEAFSPIPGDLFIPQVGAFGDEGAHHPSGCGIRRHPEA
jgi:hypothetical protein